MKQEVVMSEELEEIGGAGGEEEVSEETLQAWKDELTAIARDERVISQSRNVAEETRYCMWDGQSADGRKHREDLGEEPFPFEGASDGRLRIADGAINRRVALMVLAATRMMVRVRGIDFADEAKARKLEQLIRWRLRTQLGMRWWVELCRVANFQEGDSPGMGLMGVFWDREEALEMRQVTAEDLLRLVAEVTQDAESVDALADMILDPELEETALRFLQQVFPYLSDATARQAVRDLREEQAAEFPAPYMRVDEPCPVALRLFDDVWLPGDTRDVDSARMVIRREWISKAELRARERTHGYSEMFVEEVEQYPGETGLWDTRSDWSSFVRGDYSQSAYTLEDARKQQYEILTIYERAVNADGVIGVYCTPIHYQASVAAHPRRLLGYRHGRMPFVTFAREYVTNRLLDTRGLSELLMTHQRTLKMLHDSHNDRAQLNTVPPLEVPMNRPRAQLVIGPMTQVPMKRTGEVRWMDPPKNVQDNLIQQEEIRRQVAEYVGEADPKVAPELVQLLQLFATTQFVQSVGEVIRQVVQLDQQYLSEQTLRRILGDDGRPLASSREEIQGMFDLELSFDPRDLNMEYLKEKVAMLRPVLEMDAASTVQRDKLVQMLFNALDPTMAGATLQPVQEANVREAEEEEMAFAKIAAGVEPMLPDETVNATLRMQVIESIAQKNPEALENLSENSRGILERRVKALQFQREQRENAVIGRVGARPYLQ